MRNKTIPARKDCPATEKWHLSDIYATREDWQAARDSIPGQLDDIQSFRGRLKDPQQLLMPVDAVFAAHPPLIVTLGQAAKLKNGAQVKDWQFQPGTYRVYAEDGEFLLLGRVEGGVLTTIKSFFEVNTLGT